MCKKYEINHSAGNMQKMQAGYDIEVSNANIGIEEKSGIGKLHPSGNLSDTEDESQCQCAIQTLLDLSDGIIFIALECVTQTKAAQQEENCRN